MLLPLPFTATSNERRLLQILLLLLSNQPQAVSLCKLPCSFCSAYVTIGIVVTQRSSEDCKHQVGYLTLSG